MKKSILITILISFTISCKEFNKATNITTPKNNVFGEISNLKIGCNFNNTNKNENIKIYKPKEKELYELKSIMSFTGLPLNFKIFSAEINNACATIIDGERYILYDPKLLEYVNNKSDSYWSSVSILAHEIGHHLSGHTLNQFTDNHKAELEADKFSGFVLYKLGASKKQSTNAMKTIGSEYDSNSHPSKDKRIKSIEKGWNEAYEQDYHSALPPPLKDDPEKFYEYTMEMLYDEEFQNYYNNDYSEKYDFMYGVVLDTEEDKNNFAENTTIEIIKTGKIWEKNHESLDGVKLTFFIHNGEEMCNACWHSLSDLLKPGRRVKFAWNEGHPGGGSAYNYVKNLSYIKAISNESLDFYSRVSNTKGKNKIINDFLIAEENRDLNKILSYYSNKISRYWNVNELNKIKLSKLYRKSWKKSSYAQNLVKNIIKVNNNIYILETNFTYFDKENKYKSINNKVKFIFDDNDKIIETFGVKN